MWRIRTFKTKENMKKFLVEHKHIQYNEIFINNGYAIEYRQLKRIY